ncbi:MAG: alpha/beta fold hydrolase [Hyphomicrobiaceae bacterium]
MSGAGDLFPGFSEQRFNLGEAEIYARLGGSGPPLLLLHGYPQTHACWHKMAPELAQHFSLVMPDLRGYGRSRGPKSDQDHLGYSKRAMAADFVAVMQQLGHERFSIVSHDRGARVGYRLALDHGARVERLVTLDVVTTLDAWTDMAMDNAVGRFHWPFLARPSPFPETMIGHDPVFFLEYLLSQWTAAKDLSAFDALALGDYRWSFSQPTVIHATCEDYRAGASCDPAIDAADRKVGRQIACPMLALWGASRKHGFVNKPLETWRAWCPHVVGGPVESGHFLPEEAADETLAAVMPFLMATV